MNWQKLKNQDPFITILVLILSAIGLLIIYSTTFTYPAESSLGQMLPKQILFLILGTVIYFVLISIDLSWFEDEGFIKIMYMVILALLIIVKFFGETRAGTNRWIDIGFFSLQPAEYAKIAIILLSAKNLTDIKLFEAKPLFRNNSTKLPKALLSRPVAMILLKNALLVIPLILLILIQPSLGNAMISLSLWLLLILILFPKPMLLTKVIMMLSLGISLSLQIFEVRFQSPDFIINQYSNINWLGMIIVLGVTIASIIALRISPKIFLSALILGIIIIVGIPNVWNGAMTAYQKQRVLTYFEGPESDPTGSGYQIIQSKIAIGSGMLSGRGYLQGTQSSLQVLTQSFTDFAFAAYAEQFGFIGVIILLFIYFLLLLRILKVARNTRNTFGKYTALGICLLLFLHIFINIGMNMGLLPVTGIPLPLISYGGSATVMIMICLGLVQSVQSSQRSVDIADNLMVTSRSLLMN
jgi:rod shape determining protein RodA